jgi:energy-coupling factor transport system substrate-specific component
MLLLCLAGAILNIIFHSFFCELLGFPLFLDTVMTIAVTIFGGPVYGMITGALSNIISHSFRYWGWEGYLFTLCNMATAVITWMFMRLFPAELDLNYQKKVTDNDLFGGRRLNTVVSRMAALMLLSFALCIAMSVLGGIISGLITVFNTSIESDILKDSVLFAPATFPGNIPILRDIIDRIPVNIVDRLISAFAGFGVAYVLQVIGKRVTGTPYTC